MFLYIVLLAVKTIKCGGGRGREAISPKQFKYICGGRSFNLLMVL